MYIKKLLTIELLAQRISIEEAARTRELEVKILFLPLKKEDNT